MNILRGLASRLTRCYRLDHKGTGARASRATGRQTYLDDGAYGTEANEREREEERETEERERGEGGREKREREYKRGRECKTG